VTEYTVDMRGSTVAITGASSGIGLASATALAAMGATVVMVNRDLAKSEVAMERIAAQTGNDSLHLVLCDLASFESVRQAARTLLRDHPRLDVLLLNAGLIAPARVMTEDGNELTFQVDHLSHFLLAALVRGSLIARAPARIVSVSSSGHRAALSLPLHDLTMERGWSPMRAYSVAKLANVLFAREAARRLAGTRVSVNAVHPGGVRTGFGVGEVSMGGLGGFVWGTVMRPFLRTPEEGADSAVWLASSQEGAALDGAYVADRRERAPSSVARNDGLARMMWARSEELTGASWPPAHTESPA
jgi:NAD(P)-dependent dehydrogenase (short-subunit alcohol dehydrogenase family)